MAVWFLHPQASWTENEVAAGGSDSEESGEYAGDDMQRHDRVDEDNDGGKFRLKIRQIFQMEIA